MPKLSDSTDTNALEVTVTELSGRLKRTVEDTFGHVRVRGEISGFRGPHSSGHCYFSLKDDRARLEAVIWRGQAAKLKHMPEEGLEVIASGKLTTYPGSSKYQIVIDNLEPAGAGALMALLEERKKKLGAEGLFADSAKKPLPFMPRHIAVVTSPTGAVIRDVLHRIADRFPVHVTVWPVRVQGETTGREVANAVHQLNIGKNPPDLIIVARGGGSLEDLWGFNDEVVVRSVFASAIPVISAVGHETDWTLIDLVADHRAPTPTAAAERAVPVKADLEATVADLGARVRGAVSRLIVARKTQFRATERGLSSPDQLFALPRRAFDEASGRLSRGLVARIARSVDRFRLLEPRLDFGHVERMVGKRRDLLDRTIAAHSRSLLATVRRKREIFDSRSRTLRPVRLVRQVEDAKRMLGKAGDGLDKSMIRSLETRRRSYEQSERLLETLGFKQVLKRGYAVIRDADGAPRTRLAGLDAGSGVEIEMQDGKRAAVLGEDDDAPISKPVRKPAKQPRKPVMDNQGSLF